MKPSFTDTGIIIKSIDFAEADKLIGILSHRHGYQEYIARGARRLNSKKAPHLDLFNHVKFQIGRGNAPQMLVQADTQEYFPHLRSSLEKARVALSIAEILTSLMPQEEEDRESYLSLVNFMKALEIARSASELSKLSRDYSLYLLRHLGYPQPKSVDGSNLSYYFETIINRRLLSRELK